MRIIAVCDKRPTLNSLENAIEMSVKSDAELKTFMLPSEALQYARGHPVDVAFVDMDMKLPLMHGLFLAKELAKLNPKVNLVFVSETDEYATEAWSLRASDYLRKPVIQEHIERVMGGLRYHTV